jgi:hypothetical protein
MRDADLLEQCENGEGAQVDQRTKVSDSSRLNDSASLMQEHPETALLAVADVTFCKVITAHSKWTALHDLNFKSSMRGYHTLARAREVGHVMKVPWPCVNRRIVCVHSVLASVPIDCSLNIASSRFLSFF